MHIIKIFISSSIKFSDLREQIRLFFDSKNKIWSSNCKLFFETIVCEDFDNYITSEGSQDSYNKDLSTCNYMLLFYSNRVGKYTLEEFIKSINSNVKTYVYKLPDSISNESIPDKSSVDAFVEVLKSKKYFEEKADNLDQLLNKFYNNIEKNDILDLIINPNFEESYFLSKNSYKINRDNEVLYFTNNIVNNMNSNCTLFIYKANQKDQPNYYNYRLDEKINCDNLYLTTEFKYIDINRIFDPYEEKSKWFIRFLDELNNIYGTKLKADQNLFNMDNLTKSFSDLLNEQNIKKLIIPFKVEGQIELNDSDFVNDIIIFLNLFDFGNNNGSGIYIHFVFNVDIENIKESFFFKQIQNKFQVNEFVELKLINKRDINKWSQSYSKNTDCQEYLVEKIISTMKRDGYELPNHMSRIDNAIQKVIKDLVANK